MSGTQCLWLLGVFLSKALKTIFPENYPYSSCFHTEVRRTNVFYNSSAARLSADDITQV
ncbi:hypothetical protein [Microcystis sp. MC19]|uniref:hypothetical protein n=1 Tax=Microcystis sp. MC19 TaxID=1967666 RepID=UPI001C1FFC53|nr:hypothetical protein [Microcystis sp. MC19]